MAIKAGIVGYGNLGKGVECAIKQNADFELKAVFSRREPQSLSLLHSQVPVCAYDTILEWKEKLDILILCGGSATDLPRQTPELARYFNVVDSFDTHAKIPEHFQVVQEQSLAGGFVSVIGVGWDPGLFSLNRLYAESVLPQGKEYTFWGKGISQGHSDAIRRIAGVKDAKQYTIPIEKSLQAVREGHDPELSIRQKHLRECFVVLEAGQDQSRIEEEIKYMPNYFADYDTVVHFISQEELDQKHSGMPHGGKVIRSGKTGWESNTSQLIEYSLQLRSNPEFTASVLVAYARAGYRLYQEGNKGCKTVLDIPPVYLSAFSNEELRRKLL